MRRAGMIAMAAAAAVGAGCIPHYVKGDWPHGVPTETFYARAYLDDGENRRIQTSGEYFDWVIRFYKGYTVVTGWHVHEQELARNMTLEEFLVLAPQVAYIGQIISAEWAKHNNLRRINNDTLTVWGKVLRRASKEHRSGRALDTITADAHAILENRLTAKEIKASRYEELFKAGK